MLRFALKTLPLSELTYVALRLACLDIRERLELALQLDLNHDHRFGYLTMIPFLNDVPAQIQLKVLLETWRRHCDAELYSATLIDEGVLFAACETAAQMLRSEPEIAWRILARGPATCGELDPPSLSDQLQQVHLEYAKEGRFQLISQFQDIAPRTAALLKFNNGITPAECEVYLEPLAHWYVSTDILAQASGLLTRVETEQFVTLLKQAGCCRDEPKPH